MEETFQEWIAKRDRPAGEVMRWLSGYVDDFLKERDVKDVAWATSRVEEKLKEALSDDKVRGNVIEMFNSRNDALKSMGCSKGRVEKGLKNFASFMSYKGFAARDILKKFGEEERNIPIGRREDGTFWQFTSLITIISLPEESLIRELAEKAGSCMKK